MKNLKRLSRVELKKINGGKKDIAGYGCTDACHSDDGVCEQYGLSCGLWVSYNNTTGEVNYACLKCF